MRAEEFLLEVPLPPDWDATTYSQPKSFKAMVDYAVERALRLGAGSSRVVFTIPFEGRPTALKIAKNAKGLAQNNAEASLLNDGYIRSMGIAIPIIDFGEDSRHRTTWLQTEVAKKITDSQLRKYFGLTTMFDLTRYVRAIHTSTNTATRILEDLESEGQTEEQQERFIEYAEKIASLEHDFNVLPGDFDRAVNWGVYQGHPVIIDLGFTEEVYRSHYS